MAQAYRAPVNYRSSPARVGTPEGIAISGGIAMLSESPADPANPATPVVVVVNGTPRTRVTGAPAAGQYRIRSQIVIGVNGLPRTEYLPILDFHASDEGLSGTVDYYAVGTVLTSEWVDALMSLLTPLTGIATAPALQSLYPATTNLYAPGRPGRIAFLSDNSMYYSNGVQWISVAANVSPNNWSEALAVFQRFGLQSTSGFSAAWSKAQDLAQSFGVSSASGYSTPGAAVVTLAAALAQVFDSAFAASWASAGAMAAGMGLTVVSNYTAGGGPLSLGLFNPQFESAIGSVEGDNWWPYTDGTASGEASRVTSGVVSGSGSGRVWTSGYFNAEVFVPAFAGLQTRFSKVALDGSSGHLKFRARRDAAGGSAYVLAHVYDPGGALISINGTGTGVENAMLWGPNVGSSPNVSAKIAPALGTVYDFDLDLAAWLSSICTWASASKVVLNFVATATDFPLEDFVIDDFQAR